METKHRQNGKMLGELAGMRELTMKERNLKGKVN